MPDSSDTSAPATGDLAQQVVKAYEKVAPDSLKAIKSLYTPDVFFEDPAHGLQGIDALMDYFESLLKNVTQCRFQFHHHFSNGSDISLYWTLLLQHRRMLSGETVYVEGSSHLKTRNGKVYYHRDYFDLGEMVYENLPLLGGLVRRIKQRLSR